MSRKYQDTIHVIDSATATETSQPINIEDATSITLVFKRSDHSSGSTAFTVTVSVDGTNFIAYNKLIDNVTNSNAQQLTRVASSSLASNTTKFYTMDLSCDTFKEIKVTATQTTDGTHDAWLCIQR